LYTPCLSLLWFQQCKSSMNFYSYEHDSPSVSPSQTIRHTWRHNKWWQLENFLQTSNLMSQTFHYPQCPRSLTWNFCLIFQKNIFGFQTISFSLSDVALLIQTDLTKLSTITKWNSLLQGLSCKKSSKTIKINQRFWSHWELNKHIVLKSKKHNFYLCLLLYLLLANKTLFSWKLAPKVKSHLTNSL